MLKELRSTRQIPGEPLRRWYSDNDTDLITWLEQYRVIGFQLLAPHQGDRAVVTWHEGRQPMVAVLDDGEGRPGRPKMTPILSESRTIDITEVSLHFAAVSTELPPGLTELVQEKLREVNESQRKWGEHHAGG